jgi:hypothetical protein
MEDDTHDPENKKATDYQYPPKRWANNDPQGIMTKRNLRLRDAIYGKIKDNGTAESSRKPSC